MDKIILVIFFGLAVCGLTKQSSAAIEKSSSSKELYALVPDAVKNTFSQRYKGAQQIVWDNKDDQYKATFQYKGKTMFAFFDRSGYWMKSFTKVNPQDLPVSVMLYIQEHLDGYELSRHYLRADTEVESYAVAVKKGTDYVWMQFDLDGKFISSQV
ncbi:MAG: hypothetical protein ACR2MX_00680 [Cyclobacteriaceae bacterium]